jgi:protein SCO1
MIQNLVSSLASNWSRIFMKTLFLSIHWAVIALMGVSLVACSRAPQTNAEAEPQVGIALVQQDGAHTRFPFDLRGAGRDKQNTRPTFLLVGFIYTHCPGVCVTITQTMKRVAALISANTSTNTPSVKFVEITFDPERDSSAALWEYGRLHGLEHEMQSGTWAFLTGKQAQIDSLMKRYGIQTKRSYTEFNHLGEKVYFIDHTDRIALMNARGEVLREYESSEVQPEEIVRDIQAIRQ